MKSMPPPPPVTSALTALRRRVARRKFQFEAEPAHHGRRLFVDVSVIVTGDARTGIQRVVRALLGQLASAVDPSITVQPVFASKEHGYCKALLLPDGEIRNASSRPMGRQPVEVGRGDVFLGLDLAAHLLPHLESDLRRFKRQGATINIMVYDLLPVVQPGWFSPRTGENFKRWLGVLARQADLCIGISDDVTKSLSQALRARAQPTLPDFATIPLGHDLVATYPSRGLPANIAELRAWVKSHKVVLAVGTIEPRKGYQVLLAALDRHWLTHPESDVALLIVGKSGWKTEKLQERISNHPELGRRLIWLKEASDELLEELYTGAAGLVAASHGEGFGLPLIEALSFGTPVLARDLPVFREIGGPLFDYFENDTADALAARIEDWLASVRPPAAKTLRTLPTWADSAAALAHCIGVGPTIQTRGDGV